MGDISNGITDANSKYEEYQKTAEKHGDSSQEAIDAQREWIDILDDLAGSKYPEIINKTEDLTLEEQEFLRWFQQQIDKTKELGIISPQIYDEISKSIKDKMYNVQIPAWLAGQRSVEKYKNELKEIPTSITTEIIQAYKQTGMTTAEAYKYYKTELQTKAAGGKAHGYIQDLGILAINDEWILPKAITNAIKTSRSDALGLSMAPGNKQAQPIVNTFNISGITIREDADIQKIAESLYSLQVSKARGMGIR